MGRRVIFAVHDWGLGHATRSLLLIRALIDRGDAVTIVMAEGDGMQLLKEELGETCEFHPCKDIPKPFSRWPAVFYTRMSLDTPLILARFRIEHRMTERMVRQRGFDLVISDSRFGVYSRDVPSYCILHSLRQIIPGRLHWMERLVEWGQRGLLGGFSKILIPDVEEDGGLSGDLGHHPALDWGPGRLVYTGPISSIRRQTGPEDIDCFFSVSGIEPQRSLLARKVLDALPQVPGNVVVALGKPSASDQIRTIGGATIYGYLDRRAQAEMLNRARLVMTRSGYTTLMELAELGKRALFIPTPGQSEQEYLARFHHARGHVFATTQGRLDIPHDIVLAAAMSGVPHISSADSVRRFLAAVG